MNQPTRVIGYVRVSTEEQAESGLSRAAQGRRIASYCAAHDLDLHACYVDNGISAKRMSNRPALQAALSALEAHDASGLVVLKLDRLSRSTRDVLDLVDRSDRKGWKVHSIDERLDTGSAAGRFVVTVLGALAQMEREQIGERTRVALAEKRRQGKRISRHAPFGFRHEDRDGETLIVAAPAERRILERMLALYAEGKRSMRIAKALNGASTFNPRTGRPWNRGTVEAIVRTARKVAS